MKDQYLLLVFAFSFMAAYRLTVSFNLRAVLQMALFALPLTALISAGEEGVTPWAYACLSAAVVWWFLDLYTIFKSARVAYHGKQRIRITQSKDERRPASKQTAISGQPARQVQAPNPIRANAGTLKPEPEKVEMVSLKSSDIEYGPVIGTIESKPIFEWVAAQGRQGRAHYVGILGRGASIEDNDLLLAPGLVYRWSAQACATNAGAELETA
jgi:hypothetical protein